MAVEEGVSQPSLKSVKGPHFGQHSYGLQWSPQQSNPLCPVYSLDPFTPYGNRYEGWLEVKEKCTIKFYTICYVLYYIYTILCTLHTIEYYATKSIIYYIYGTYIIYVGFIRKIHRLANRKVPRERSQMAGTFMQVEYCRVASAVWCIGKWWGLIFPKCKKINYEKKHDKRETLGWILLQGNRILQIGFVNANFFSWSS